MEGRRKVRGEGRQRELEHPVLAALRACELGLSLLLADETGRVVFANRDSESLFECSSTQLQKRQLLGDLLTLDEPLGDCFEAQAEYIRQAGRWEGEGRAVRPGGKVLGCEIILVDALLSRADGRHGLLALVSNKREERRARRLLEESVAFSNALNEQLDHMNQELLQVKRQLEYAVGAQRRELQAVAELQQSLLPRRLPKLKGYDFAAIYVPSSQASGDYYDFFEIGPSALGLLVADVSGHGARAAVDMAITRVLVHSAVKETLSPGAALSRLNSMLSDSVPTESFVTMFYGVLDPCRQMLRFALAGHPPPLLWKPGETAPQPLQRAPGFPLHVVAQTEFAEHEVYLPPRSVLFLYTDGLTEAFNSRREMYGVDRLARLLGQLPPGPTQAMVDEVRQAVRAFTGGAALADDFTAVAIQAVNS